MWDLSSCVSMRKCCWPSASGRWRQLAKILKSWGRKSDKGGWVMQVVENNGCISSNSTHAWLLGCTSRDFKWTVVGKQFKIEIVSQFALIVCWISMKVHLQQLKNFILVFDVSLSRWVIVVLKAGAPLRLLINFSWKSAKYKKASPPIDVLSLLKGRLFRNAAFLCTCLHSHTQPCRRINSQPFFLTTILLHRLSIVLPCCQENCARVSVSLVGMQSND